jgi:hypothetical protein
VIIIVAGNRNNIDFFVDDQIHGFYVAPRVRQEIRHFVEPRVVLVAQRDDPTFGMPGECTGVKLSNAKANNADTELPGNHRAEP